MTKCGHYPNTVSCYSFIKMHGLGNDYVFIDAFPPETNALLTQTDLPALARAVSDRHRGVGSDGLVLILPDQETDARMRIFNADGSEAEMCGNAIRCLGKYLYESGTCPRTHLRIATLAGIRELDLQLQDERVTQVTVKMGIPHIEKDIFLPHTCPQIYYKVNMGNPHAVFFCEPLPRWPENTNVEFVHVRNNKELDVRVIERGSGETMACGTGACASAAAAISNGFTDRTVTVHLPGGDLLIRQDADGEIYMTGTATEAFRGEYKF